jgi:hypothetical protein
MTRSRSRLDLRSISELLELADYAVAFAIRAAANLGIADHITDEPRPVADIATATGTHTESLHRILRILTSKGIFTEPTPGAFATSPTADLLRTDHPLSLRGLCYLMPHDIHAWAQLDHTLRTGESAFDHVHHQNYWDYLATHPDESQRFDTSQQAATRLELLTALRAYDWSSLTTIVDLGGGNGAFLAGLLTRNPHLHGTLIDLPHVVTGAPPILAKAGVTDRCTIIGTDFFTNPPPPADAYLLSRCLYGWDDEHARTLLRSIRTAMPANSRLLVIEPIRDTADGSTATVDLLMAVLSTGHVRDLAEIGTLLQQAGLEVHKLHQSFPFPILDVRPSADHQAPLATT